MTEPGGGEASYASLSDYLRVLRANWLLIVAVTVAFGGVAYLVTSGQRKTFEASAEVAFQDPTSDLGILGVNAPPQTSAESRAAQGVDEVTRPAVLTAAAKKLGLPRGTLEGSVSAGADARTNFVSVLTRDSDARRAATISNAVADAVRRTDTAAVRARFRSAASVQSRRLAQLPKKAGTFAAATLADRVSRLETLASIAEPVLITRRATIPSTPIAPRPRRNALLAALLGLTLAIVASFVRDSLDRRLRGVQQIEQAVGLPIVGRLGKDLMGRTLVGAGDGKPIPPREFEAARILRTNLDLIGVGRGLHSVIVTSALPEEGKSTTAAALAYASALVGKRVLLLEADLRRPSLGKRLGGGNSAGTSLGFADLLAGSATEADVVQRISLGHSLDGSADGVGPAAPKEGFDFISAGSPTSRPAELLASAALGEFLLEVASRYDLVVLDTSPLLAVADTLELIPNVESVVLCVRHGRTTRQQATAAKSALDRFADRPSGAVVTGAPHGGGDYYGGYAYGTYQRA